MKRRILIPIVLILLMLFNSTLIALADGGAGGGGPPTHVRPGHWRIINGAPGTSQAIDQFFRVSGFNSRQNFYNRITASGNMFGDSNLLQNCRSSRFIWYYAQDNGSWSTLGAGTHNTAWFPSPPADDWANFMSWGSGIWNQGNVVLICSGSFDPVEKDCSFYEYQDRIAEYSITGVYSSSSMLTPVRTVEFDDYTFEERQEWSRYRHPQATVEYKNAFGYWFDANRDSINNLGSFTGEEFENRWAHYYAQARAILDTDYILNPQIVLSEENRTGFSIGAIFTITESRRIVTIDVPATQQQRRHVDCTARYFGSGRWEETRNYGPWIDYGFAQTTGPSQIQITSLTPYSFWQMLNARCNLSGIQAIENSYDVINKTYGDPRISGTLYTNVYHNINALPFGNPNHNNPALAATSSDAFFTSTESCQDLFVCVPERQPGADNDSENNVGDDGDGNYGAQVDGRSSDIFQFFRENLIEEVRADLWWPQLLVDIEGLEFDSTIEALGTQLIFDPDGTPANDMFVMEDADGNLVVNGEMIQSNNGIFVEGQLNRFNVRSAWASEQDYPHRFNVTWIYGPEIFNHVLNNVSGGGARFGENSTSSSPIDIFCDMRLNTSDNQEARIENNILSNSRIPEQDFSDIPGTWIGIMFIRSAAE